MVRVEQRSWTADAGWRASPADGEPGGFPAELALLFGSGAALRDASLVGDVRRRYPGARLLGCSTAGEIHGTQVLDDSLCVTAVHLEGTTVQGAKATLADPKDSYEAGRRLVAELPKEGLVHVFVLSDGHVVNGSALVAGLAAGLPPLVRVTGGLAGDGERFGETVVLWDEPGAGAIAALGF